MVQSFSSVDGPFSYGRLVALMSLSCQLAVNCARDDLRSELDRIHIYTYNYLNGHIMRDWPVSGNSWVRTLSTLIPLQTGFLRWSDQRGVSLKTLWTWKGLATLSLLGGLGAITINRLIFS